LDKNKENLEKAMCRKRSGGQLRFGRPGSYLVKKKKYAPNPFMLAAIKLPIFNSCRVRLTTNTQANKIGGQHLASIQNGTARR